MKQKRITAAILVLALAFGVDAAAGGRGLSAVADLFGDINFDGEVNAGDAAEILQFAAYKGSGGTDSLETYLNVQPSSGSLPEDFIFVEADITQERTNPDATGFEYYLNVTGNCASYECTVQEYAINGEELEYIGAEDFPLDSAIKPGEEHRQLIYSASDPVFLEVYLQPKDAEGYYYQTIYSNWSTKAEQTPDQ